MGQASPVVPSVTMPPPIIDVHVHVHALSARDQGPPPLGFDLQWMSSRSTIRPTPIQRFLG